MVTHLPIVALLAALSSSRYQGTCNPPLTPVPLDGFYTDSVTYAPGDVISVFANWPGKRVKYRIVRAGLIPSPATTPLLEPQDWEEFFLEQGNGRTYDSQVLSPGSFVDFGNQVNLSGSAVFTLEGWIWPTYAAPDCSGPEGNDYVVIAGQAAQGSRMPTPSSPGGAWIGIDGCGRLFGGVVLNDLGTVREFEVRDGSRLQLMRWHYVALTFSAVNKKLRLFRATENLPTLPRDPPFSICCLQQVASTDTQGSSVLATSLPFRLGARQEAPGDLTGCFDGRLDQWRIWNLRLTLQQLQSAMNQTRTPFLMPATPHCTSCTTSCMTAPLPANNAVALHVDFQGDSGVDSDFYPQDSVVLDVSGNGRHGAIVNHGTPWLAGPSQTTPSGDRALRINHDQLVDAAFDRQNGSESAPPPVVNLALNPAWPSGLYAVQALFESASRGGEFDAYSAENRDPGHFSAFVLRPAAKAPPKPIAVVVPTNTWLAYNNWPGSLSTFGYPESTATDITVRQSVPKGCPFPAPTPNCIPQGVNSGCYDLMGDGVSASHFSGWLRPNILASPALKSNPVMGKRPLNDQGAYLAARMFEWLENPIGIVPFNGAGMYDAFSDWDLDDGMLQLVSSGDPRYSAVMLFGKAEYWGGAMLQKLNDYAKAGGSIISIGGNMMAWRSERFYQSGTALNTILEVKKWPLSNAYGLFSYPTADVGIWDRSSAMDGLLTGVWRYKQQCEASDPFVFTSDPMDDTDTVHLRDYVLGTLPDMGGGGLSELGMWEVRDSMHWLWGGSVVASEDLCSIGRVVGDEADGYACGLCPTGCAGSLGHLGNSLPPDGMFPFSATNKVALLAWGSDFGTETPPLCGGIPAPDNDNRYDFCNESFDYDASHCADNSFLDSAPQCADTTRPLHMANITYYDSKWGGRMLSVGSINSVLALRYHPITLPSTANEAVLSDLVGRALDCIVNGMGCGVTTDSPNCSELPR